MYRSSLIEIEQNNLHVALNTIKVAHYVEIDTYGGVVQAQS